MTATTPALIRLAMEQLAASMCAAGWDAKALVVEQGDGTVLIGLTSWMSWHPAAGVFPAPILYSANGEPLATINDRSPP
jgi:hypothetical protein